MKLNNRGWGLGVFILFLFLFFIVLMVVAYEINKINSKFIEDSSVPYVEVYK